MLKWILGRIVRFKREVDKRRLLQKRQRKDSFFQVIYRYEDANKYANPSIKPIFFCRIIEMVMNNSFRGSLLREFPLHLNDTNDSFVESR